MFYNRKLQVAENFFYYKIDLILKFEKQKWKYPIIGGPKV